MKQFSDYIHFIKCFSVLIYLAFLPKVTEFQGLSHLAQTLESVPQINSIPIPFEQQINRSIVFIGSFLLLLASSGFPTLIHGMDEAFEPNLFGYMQKSNKRV